MLSSNMIYWEYITVILNFCNYCILFSQVRLLLHDNAPIHNDLSIQQFLDEKRFALLKQPPYLLYLASCNFLFSSDRGDHQPDLFWRRGGQNDGAEGHPRITLQQCIEAWQRRMEQCIRLEGDYFEGKTM